MKTSQQAEKTKNQIVEKAKIKRIFLFTTLSLGALIIFIAPLVHIGFPVKNHEVEKYKETLKISVNALNNKIVDARAKYNSNEITAEAYINENEALQLELSNLLSRNDQLISTKVDEERIYGWQTTRTFLIGLGIRLPYLLFSLIISWLIAFVSVRDRNLKVALKYLQITCYTMSFYQLLWCFWYVQDYPLETYWYAFIFFCALAAVLFTHLFKYYRTKEMVIANLKGSFLNFIVEIRNVHYRKLLGKAVKSDLYNEAYQQELKNDTKEFENRIHDKAEEIVD